MRFKLKKRKKDLNLLTKYSKIILKSIHTKITEHIIQLNVKRNNIFSPKNMGDFSPITIPNPTTSQLNMPDHIKP